MSYLECVRNLEMIESDIDDGRYTRMRLAEIYGCIMCSNMTTEECNRLVDEWIRIASKVGLTLNRMSDIFYTLEW